ELGHATDHAGDAGRFAHSENAHGIEQTTGLGDVDIGDIGGARTDDIHGAARTANALIGHQWDADASPYFRHSGEVIRREWLFDEFQIIGLHGTDHADRMLRVGPTHVAVDPQLD